MKRNILLSGFLVFATTLLSGEVYAGYTCKSYDGKASLELYTPEKGRAYEVVLKNEGGEILFGATATQVDESYLYSKYEYHLSNADTDKSVLTIVSRIRMGRGDHGMKVVTGKLLHHEVETQFTCAENDL